MKKKNQVRTVISEVSSLDEKLIDLMFDLFEKYYVDISAEQFRKDLFEKTHVFLFFSGSNLIGFSTIFRKLLPHVADGVFLFSGDTVIHEDQWGEKFLQKAFFRYIVESKVLALHKPVYWMLISKGFKTYLMMRKNFEYSFPSSRLKSPPKILLVMNRFYSWKFGDAYSNKTGLITFESAKGAVKGDFADPAAHHLENPDVKYFLKHNPNYKKGVELACIAEIRWRDFAGHIPKYFMRKKKLKVGRSSSSKRSKSQPK